MDETELIQVEVEQTGRSTRTPEKVPPDAGKEPNAAQITKVPPVPSN